VAGSTALDDSIGALNSLPRELRNTMASTPDGTRNGNYKHGARSKETIQLWKLIKSLK
jgi:hypothetical protein